MVSPVRVHLSKLFHSTKKKQWSFYKTGENVFSFPVSQASVLRKARVGSEYKIRAGGGDDSEEYTQL